MPPGPRPDRNLPVSYRAFGREFLSCPTWSGGADDHLDPATQAVRDAHQTVEAGGRHGREHRALAGAGAGANREVHHVLVVGERAHQRREDPAAVPRGPGLGPPGVRLAAVVLSETTSLGVRKLSAERFERPRREQIVETRFGAIPVKIAEGPYGPPQAKPEFDACERAAERAGVSVREVLQAALEAWRSS